MNPILHGRRHEIGMDLLVKGFRPDDLNRIYFNLTAGYEADRLIMETATLDEIDEEYNDGDPIPDDEMDGFPGDDVVLEAVSVKRYSQTASRMMALARVFSKYLPETITPQDAVVGKPKKSGLFTTITAQIPFSDGQVISIVFHAPDAKKIGPDDEIIAFRWLLNKRDITQAVSPENEGDISLEEVGKRIAQLVSKNSARFQSQSQAIQDQKKQVETLKTTTKQMEADNQALLYKLQDQQTAAKTAQDKIDAIKKQIETQQGINSDLENRLAALQAKQAADEAHKKVAEETAAKEASKTKKGKKGKASKTAAPDTGAGDTGTVGGVADEAASEEAQRIAMEERQKQQDESDRQVDEHNRLVKVGQDAVPGIRLQDSEMAGKMWEMKARGEISQDEWDKYVEDLYSSRKADRPEEDRSDAAVTPPEPPATGGASPVEEKAVATLNDLLSGSHDSDTKAFGDILDEAAAELESEGLMDKYDPLLNKVADYLTGLLNEKVKKVR